MNPFRYKHRKLINPFFRPTVRQEIKKLYDAMCYSVQLDEEFTSAANYYKKLNPEKSFFGMA